MHARPALLVLLCLALTSCQKGPPADDVDLFRRSHPFFNYFMKSDGPLLWRLRPGRYELKGQLGENLLKGLSEAFGDRGSLPPLEISAEGLRGGAPAPEHPGLRVLCLGDSVTFGYRTPYPELLGRKLAESLSPKSVEVINAGVPGYSLAQGRRWFERELAGWKPDLVVALFGWNDAKERLRGYQDTALMGSPWRRLLSRLRRPLNPLDALGKDPLSPEGGCCRVPPEEFAAEWKGLLASVRSAGGRLLALTYPTVFDLTLEGLDLPEGFPGIRKARVDALNERLFQLRGEEGFSLLALAEKVATQMGLAYYNEPNRDPIHPSEEGMEAIAAWVAGAVLHDGGMPGISR